MSLPFCTCHCRGIVAWSQLWFDCIIIVCERATWNILQYFDYQLINYLWNGSLVWNPIVARLIAFIPSLPGARWRRSPITDNKLTSFSMNKNVGSLREFLLNNVPWCFIGNKQFLLSAMALRRTSDKSIPYPITRTLTFTFVMYLTMLRC